MRKNSRSSPTRPGSKRGLLYSLISAFFSAPHGNFAFIDTLPFTSGYAHGRNEYRDGEKRVESC